MKKIETLAELAKRAEQLRRSGQRIGLCHGSYDVLHAGHIEHFLDARKKCDALFVTITEDSFVLKPGKPVLTSELRAKHLLELNCVDGVAVVADKSAVPAIEAIRPDFYIKGKEYERLELDATGKIYPEKESVEKHGGSLIFTEGGVVFSSSKVQAQQGMGPYIPTAQGIQLSDINAVIAALRPLKIAVLGEMIIDRWTEVTEVGVSSKALCPAVHALSYINQIGGAGVVARHTANFAAETHLFSNASLIGLPDNIQFHCVDDGELIVNRFWVPSENKRLFEEKDNSIKGVGDHVARQIMEIRPDVCVIADFGNGLISHKTAAQIIDHLRGKIPVAVMVQTNSSNFGFNRLDKYLDADLYVCDKREAFLLKGSPHASEDELFHHCAGVLQSRTPEKKIFMTLGRHGAAVIHGADGRLGIERVPNLVRSTVDTIGCGDAFYTLAALCHAARINERTSLIVANMAGASCTQWLCNEKSVTPQNILDVAKVTL